MSFSIVAVILFGFCFRSNIFTSKISNLLLPLGNKGMGVVNFHTPYFSLLLLLVLAFLLEHNVDEKYMQNIQVNASINIYLDPPKKKKRLTPKFRPRKKF